MSRKKRGKEKEAEASKAKAEVAEQLDTGGSYIEKVKHYFAISNPIHLIANDESLKKARDIAKVPTKKKKQQKKELTEAEIKSAEELYDSAYHPLTGERRPWITRLAAQTPLRAITLGGMLAYMETVPQIIFWQWLHQSITSYIDYCNRGSVPASEIGCAYSAATVGAVGTALALNRALRCSNPLAKRLIPLAAVTVGQSINAAAIKNRDITNGVTVETKAKKPVGVSKIAGTHSALNTGISRALQLAPALVITPLVLNNMEKKNKFCKTPSMEVVYAIGITALVLFLTTPFVLAAVGERGAIKKELLEENIRKAKGADKEKFLYYNRELL